MKDPKRDINIDLITNKELSASVAELDEAIHVHDLWYRNLLRVLISHAPPNQIDLMPNAHLACPFGQWYKSQASAKFFIENQKFRSLETVHEKVHEDAQKLIQFILDGAVIPLDEWDHFCSNREQMRNEMLDLQQKFEEVAKNRDPLTGIETRTSMLAEISKQQALVLRGRQACTLVMLDLDHFKNINDMYGHSAGDTVLVATVNSIRLHLRSYDRIYRYGGEEFIICMPQTNIEEGSEVIERLRVSISRLHFDFSETPVSASFGVTELKPSQSVKDAIECADKAMYEAKKRGRNCVVRND